MLHFGNMFLPNNGLIQIEKLVISVGYSFQLNRLKYAHMILSSYLETCGSPSESFMESISCILVIGYFGGITSHKWLPQLPKDDPLLYYMQILSTEAIHWIWSRVPAAYTHYTHAHIK